MANEIITRPEQAVSSALDGVIKVRGLLVSYTRNPAKRREGMEYEPKDQIEFKLSDAVILEMKEGVPQPTLKENMFTFWVPYATTGQAPTKASIWVQGITVTAKEAYDKYVDELIGQIVTIERKPVALFEKDGAWVYTERTYFQFVPDAAGSPNASEKVKDYARKLVKGKPAELVYRDLVLDQKTKDVADLIEAAKNGTIDKYLDMIVTEAGIIEDKT